MAIQTQRRGGTTREHNNFVGANREITIDTDKKTVVVHDATQQGGFPLAREDLSNVEKDTLLEKLSLDKIKGIDPVELIKKEKAKLTSEINQKINTLMTDGEELFEQIKSAVIANVHQRNLLADKTPLGVVFPYTSNTPPDGFLLLNGETLGAENSTANHTDEIYQTLYVFLWNNVNDTQLGMSEAKGDSALEDWQAGKTMRLPDLRGRSVIGAGPGNGLTNRVLGSIGGEETHQLTVNEMPSHSHSLTCGHDNDYSIADFGGSGNGFQSMSTDSVGNNAAHNNMSPWLALTWIIKY